MSKKRMDFPMEVKQGSVAVKIYRVENKGRDSFTVSYHANGKRKLQVFAVFDEALADAKSKANALARGELDALHLRAVDARAYINAVGLLNPIGVPLELAVKNYVEAWKVVPSGSSMTVRRLQSLAKESTPRILGITSTRIRNASGC